MSVHRILSTKGRNVVTIGPQRTLGEAARMLAEHRIGALLVVDGVRPVSGIVSERDIVRAVAEQGPAALEAPVSRFMTEKVVTCTTRTAVNDLMEAMTNGKFRHVPVVEDGALVGIVSIGDVVKNRLAEIEAEAQAIKDYIATA
ncbi:CBS domain-containing protein [Microvirga thermotolerans]|uniref:CBS domain-containing protein n=1 Tax=Microvirga thermotolerans TaxID=2651334 RepID=A0A5P9JYY8_9HYPH|nr:CBS domain-containing protein [Microvirga thermotolerans]QFU16856.1 CBS domain-containing protein [Microvirga thermotolerans]